MSHRTEGFVILIAAFVRWKQNMTDSRKAVLCLVALVVSAIVPLWAQMPILIDPGSAGAAVQLSPLDPDSEKTYALFFRSPADQQLKPYALLLKNISSQPIVTVSLIWTFTTADGPRSMHSRALLMSGGIGLEAGTFTQALPVNRNAVRENATHIGPLETPVKRPPRPGRSESSLSHPLAPGETMLAGPGRFAYPNGGGGVGNPALHEGDVSVVVDAVAFADGTVVGEDKTATIDALNMRNAAVAAIVSAVRTARQNGQDPIAALDQLASTPIQGRDVTTRMESQIARMLLHSPAWERQFEKLESEPVVNYHR